MIIKILMIIQKKNDSEYCNKHAIISFNTEDFLKNNNLITLFSSFISTNLTNNEWVADNKVHSSNIKLRFNKKPIIERFPLNPFANGYNINDIALSGPNAIYMKKDMNKAINSFSLLFMIKIKNFKNKFNYLYEMRCKPSYEYDEKTQKKIYTENSVTIVFKVKNDDNSEKSTYNRLLNTKIFNIELKIGSDTFVLKDINSSIFENDNTFIALIMKDKDVTFYINDIIFNYQRKSSGEIVLDNMPITINDNGGCDCIIYSFAYYDSDICKYDINSFKLYNTFYLYGSNRINNEKNIISSHNTELINKLKEK